MYSQKYSDRHYRIGILGGGQLGKMLFLAGAPLAMDLCLMDKDRSFPAGLISHRFTEGDFTKYEDVVQFGKDMDIVTVEIEKINARALSYLEERGVKVYPQADVITTIQDKGLQKEFFITHEIPTAEFELFDELTRLKVALQEERWTYPLIQKTRREGYDGRGVTLLKSGQDLNRAFTKDFLVERKVNIKKEIAVIVCRSVHGEMVQYDPVEMVFDPRNHILLYQKGPAEIPDKVRKKIQDLAMRTAEAFGIVGLLAIEMFLTVEGEVLINEVAPRPHNSGHHTIEACVCSQYENHLRAISGWPLGSPETLHKSLLVNLLGSPGYSGAVQYQGLRSVLAEKGVHVHLYGKKETRPNRKMGHITIIGDDHQELFEKYVNIISTFKVIA